MYTTLYHFELLEVAFVRNQNLLKCLVSWCCMCCCSGKTVNHLFIMMLPMLNGVKCLGCLGFSGLCHCQLQCYYLVGGIGLGQSSVIWNLMPACLMWIVWKENSCMLEDFERSLDHLKSLLIQ